MKRREFIALFGAAAWPLPLPLLWPAPAQAQAAPGGQQRNASEVGQVATLQGSATVIRGSSADAIPLQVSDAIFKNDTLETGADSTLGVTFDDQTTFSLSANTRIVINEFVYQEGGNANGAVFNVAVGTAAFVAREIAKTGDMKIGTPVATLGIRGTTGIIDVPPSGAAPGGEPRVKLYADADGHIGRIDVFDPRGAQLGTLTQGASAFALRGGPGGRLQAVPFRIPPTEAARDRGVLQRLFASHNIGRRMTVERLRSRGPNRSRPNNQRQPGRSQQPFNRNPHPGGPRGGRNRRQ